MSNLVSYCLKYGSISFKDEPLNEIDALIFSRLSYIEFSSFVTNTKFKKISLIKLLNKLLSFKDKSKYFHLKEDIELFSLISKQTRYKYIYYKKRKNLQMFERFTEKAIKVIMLAQEEARRLGHNFVGTEQILLGLIGEGTGIAAKTLKSMGVNLKDARVEVEKIIGRELPATAYKKREWWSNNDQTHSQSAAWSDVGYKTCDIILGESVTFKKEH